MIHVWRFNDELFADVCGAVEAANLRDQANPGSGRRSTLRGGFRARLCGHIRSRRAAAKTGSAATAASGSARSGTNFTANTILL
jgi:hypothetical protein